MNFFVFLLFCAGISSSFGKAPISYFYNYEGTATLGIPNIKDQYAAIGIKCLVNVQFKKADLAIVKLSDVYIAEFNGEADPCKDLPLQYSPMSDEFKTLEQPFGVHFNPKADYAFLVPKNETDFITNIRKSIMEEFPKTNLEKYFPRPEDNMKEFVLEEETLLGRCQSHYIIQRISTRNSESNGMIFNVSRQIDFDHCQDPVILKRSGMSNFTSAGKTMFQSLESRTSTSHFTMKGKDFRSLHLVESKTRGDVIMNAFFANNDPLRSLVKRTLSLQKTERVQKVLVLPQETRRVRTWKHEIATTHSIPNAKDWIHQHDANEYYFPTSEFITTGISASWKLRKECIENIKVILEKVADLTEKYDLTDSDAMPNPTSKTSGLDNTLMMSATKAIGVLSFSELKELWTRYSDERNPRNHIYRQLFIDLLASAGTKSSISFFLSIFKTTKISEARKALWFTTITNQIVDPEVVPELIKLASECTIGNETHLTSAIFLNVAILINRLCQDAPNGAVPWEIHNKSSVCTTSIIDDIFSKHLEHELKNAKSGSQQIMLIEAISNSCRTTEMCETMLQEVIANRRKYPDRVRTLAIFGMEKRKSRLQSRERIINYLLSLLINEDDAVEVRQAAFITSLTWHPDITWWQMIARMSWHERKSQISALISLTIQSLSETTSPLLEEQSRIAYSVIPLMKPVPRGVLATYNWIFAQHLRQENLDSRLHFEYFRGMFFSEMPQQIYSHLSTSFLGVDFNLFEIAISNYKFDFFGSNYLWNGQKSFGKEKITKKIQEVMEGLQIPDVPSNSSLKIFDSEMTLLTRVFDNMVSINSFTFPMHKFINNSIVTSAKGNFIHYMMPISNEVFFPTELGIPILSQVTLSTMLKVKYQFSIKYKNDISNVENPTKLTVQPVDIDFRLSTKLLPRLKILVPWSKRTIATGVDNVRKLSLPIKAHVTYNKKKDAEFEFIFLTKKNMPQKYTIFQASNIPFTATKALLPGSSLPSDYNLLVCSLDQSKSMVHVKQELGTELTGLDLSLEYQGDADYPFNKANFIQMLRSPQRMFVLLASPTSRLWQTTINFDQSKSKSTFALFGLKYRRSRSERDWPKSSELLPSSIRNLTSDYNNPLMEPLKNAFNKVFSVSDRVSDEYVDHYTTAMVFGNEKYIYSTMSTINFWEYVAYDQDHKDPGFSREIRSLVYAFCSPRSESLGPYFGQLRLMNFDAQNSADLKDRAGDFCHAADSYWGEAFFVSDGPGKFVPIWNLTISQSLSEFVCEKITDDCNENCLTYQDMALDGYRTDITYDKIRLESHFIDKDHKYISNSFRNMTNNLYELFLGSNFPVEVNEMGVWNKEDTLLVEATRLASSPYYNLLIKLPHQTAIIDQFNIPFDLNKLKTYSPFETVKPLYEDDNGHYIHKVLDSDENYCEIKKNSIRTFDGLKYTIPDLTDCKAGVAFQVKSAMPSRIKRKYDFFVKVVNKKLTAVLFAMNYNYILKATYDNFNFNGDQFPYTRGYYEIKDDFLDLTLLALDGRHLIYPTFMTIVPTKDSIRLYPMDHMKNKVVGLCGDYDGNPNNDMIGPKGCVYKPEQHDMYYASWFVINDACYKSQHILDLIWGAQSYTKTCKKVTPRF